MAKDEVHRRSRAAGEERARRGTYTETCEVVFADDREPELRRLPVRREAADARHRADNVREDVGSLLEVLHLLGGKRELESAGVVPLGLGNDRDQPVGRWQWQRPEHRVQQPVQRGVGPETQAKREDSGRGKRLVRPEKAERVAEIAQSDISLRTASTRSSDCAALTETSDAVLLVRRLSALTRSTGHPAPST